MGNTSIHLPDDLREKIDDRRDEDQSRSAWIKQAIRRELDHEHDDIDEIERELEELKDEVATLKNALIQSGSYGSYPQPTHYLDNDPDN